MSEFKRLEHLTLWSTPDKFWIESSKVKTTHLLQVSRDVVGGPCQVTMEPHLGQIPASANRKTIYGVLGIHTLPLGQVLVVITRKHNANDVRGITLWQLDSVELIPVKWRSPSMCEPLAIEAHKRCMALLAETLSTPYFYFSYNGDVTNSMQRLSEYGTPAATGKEAWERLDKRFVWNEHMLTPFLEQVKANANDMHAFLTPIIHGAVFVKRNIKINGKSLNWAIITRRSRYRAGTRFWARGSDPQGHVANFNETEQIIEVKGVGTASYIQTRGSMPMLWSQIPDIRYKPKPTVQGTNHDSESVFIAHFAEQKRIYGQPQVCINLIDSKKSEGMLANKFKGLFNNSSASAAVTAANSEKSGLVYEYFDFHKECSKMRYDRLSILVNRMAKYDFGYLAVEGEAAPGKKWNVTKKQEGAFRTNCMDCLDRTNVVQSLMAAENLVKVLKDFGVLPDTADSKTMLAQNASFDSCFKNTWADHANMVSVQYAGTGALKTDFTRTGKRTKYGLLQDGWNSMIRYYKNNFSDGFRTDGMHFFLGELSIKDIESGIVAAKYRKEGEGTLTANLPWLILGSLLMALMAVLLSPEMNFKVAATVAVCAVAAFVCSKAVIQNNELFVDFPLYYMKLKKARLR